ncbi:hypothetical protein HDU92_003066 [Lobulomyces angularis]|nr:hypothetical protein HDU92_003066 [Lobulomyces angularis]
MNQKRTSEISFNDHNAIYDAYDTKEDVENSVNLETDFNDNLKHKNTLYRSYGSLIRDGSLNLWFASERSNEKTIKKRERRNTPFLVPPAKISLSNLTPPIRRSSKIHSVCIVTTPPTPDVSAVLITVPTPPPRAYNRGPRAMETVRNDNSTSVTSATVNVSTARTLRNSFEVYGYDKKPTSSHVKQNKKLNYFRFAQSIFSTVTLIISIYLEALVYTSTSTKYFCKYLSASTIIFSSISVATNHFFALSYFKFKHLKNVLIAEVSLDLAFSFFWLICFGLTLNYTLAVHYNGFCALKGQYCQVYLSLSVFCFLVFLSFFLRFFFLAGKLYYFKKPDMRTYF